MLWLLARTKKKQQKSANKCPKWYPKSILQFYRPFFSPRTPKNEKTHSAWRILRRGRRQTRAPLSLLLLLLLLWLSSLVVVVVVAAAFKSETPGALPLAVGRGRRIYGQCIYIYIQIHSHVDAVMQVHNILTNWSKCIYLERGYD